MTCSNWHVSVDRHSVMPYLDDVGVLCTGEQLALSMHVIFEVLIRDLAFVKELDGNLTSISQRLACS